MKMSRCTSQELEAYRATLKQREAIAQAHLSQRLEKARQLALEAAALLKEQFHAERVMLFGSLVHGGWFSPSSDVDLAVWGLDPLTYLSAVAQLQDLSPDFKVDLVRMERCSTRLEQVILKEGQVL
jgi:predicted nucleotidyltransferase